MEMAVDFLKEINLNAYQSQAACKTLQWICDKNLSHALESDLSKQEIVWTMSFVWLKPLIPKGILSESSPIDLI
jgi:hypothetical protein